MNQHLALITKTTALIEAGDIVGADAALTELADAEGDGALMVVLEQLQPKDILAVMREYDDSKASVVNLLVTPEQFARALVQGDTLISDLYSNTQVMTGETLAGLGSSAAILYYNDFVTYPDNTTEPTDLLLAPLPHAAGTATPLMPQAGVGLCAFKTTDQKAEAAAVFLRWLTEQQRNLEFAADTGYMPVSSAAFDAIADYPFEQQSYQRLYDVYNEMRIQNTPLSEPGIVGYHAKAKTLYDSLRQRQKDYPQRLADGETLEALAEETWQLLCDNA